MSQRKKKREDLIAYSGSLIKILKTQMNIKLEIEDMEILTGERSTSMVWGSDCKKKKKKEKHICDQIKFCVVNGIEKNDRSLFVEFGEKDVVGLARGGGLFRRNKLTLIRSCYGLIHKNFSI